VQYPGSAGYPTFDEWRALNTSVSGRLLKFSNPGKVCYGSEYDKAACSTYKVQFNNATYVGENPFLTNWPQYAGNPCPPPPPNVTTAGRADECSAGRYPDYVVAATNAEDVSAALKWASKTGVRVVIKNTGHDFLGRFVTSNPLLCDNKTDWFIIEMLVTDRLVYGHDTLQDPNGLKSGMEQSRAMTSPENGKAMQSPTDLAIHGDR
jgi:hypothetical protein